MPAGPSTRTGGADEKVGELRGELRAVGRQVDAIAERQDQVLYIDPADHHLKRRQSDGTIVDLG